MTMQKNQRILALDLARVAGAAWRDNDGRIVTRAFTVGKKGADNVPRHLVELDQIVTSLIEESACDAVSIEKDFGRGSGSSTLRSYHAVAAMASERVGKRVIKKLMPCQARKRATGYGGGDKEEVERRAFLLIPGVNRNMTNDEIDAAILLVATESLLEEEAKIAAIKRAAKKRRAA